MVSGDLAIITMRFTRALEVRSSRSTSGASGTRSMRTASRPDWPMRAHTRSRAGTIS